MSEILDAKGNPVPTGESQTDIPDFDEAEVAKEIGDMMANPNIKSYGMALATGTQLAAWGQWHLMQHGNYSDVARMTMLQIIGESMMNADGTTRVFSEPEMALKLEELLPFVKHKVKQHVKAAKKADAETARKVMRDAQEAEDAKGDNTIDAKDKFGKETKDDESDVS